MDSVIPRIMDSLRKQRKDSMSGVSELLLSFVAAFEHVPRDRRLTLFRSLVETIGVDEFLFALLILLHNKLPNRKEALQFSIDLLDCYEAESQLQVGPSSRGEMLNRLTNEQTADRYLATILDALHLRPTFSVHLLERNPPNISEEAVADLLSHIILLLRDKRLVAKISEAFALERTQVERLRLMLSQITNQTLTLSRRFPKDLTSKSSGVLLPIVTNYQQSRLCARSYLQSFSVDFPWWILSRRFRTCLTARTPRLASPLHLSNTQANTSQTCLDALKVCELRLGDGKPVLFNGHKVCLNFLSKLSSVIEESQHESNRRAALVCIDHIVERFGKKDIAAVVRVTSTVAGSRCLGAESEEMRVTSLLCLSTVVDVAQDEFVPFIPRTLPKTLSALSSEIEEGNCSKRLHNAAYSFFSALLLYTPWAVAGPDLNLLLEVSQGSANASLAEECFSERRATLDLIARQIEPRECCAALERTWANAMAEGPGVIEPAGPSSVRDLTDCDQALKEHLLVLENLLGRLSKSAIGRQSEAFVRLLTKAFDLRRIQFCPRTEESYEESEVEEVEDASTVAAMALVTKVNDTIFRPIFAQLVEWAANSSAKAKIHRQTTIYSFFRHFFDHFKVWGMCLLSQTLAEFTLQSIVTNYAALIIEDAIEILKTSVLTNETSKLQQVKVMQTLHECFRHDQDGTSRARIQRLAFQAYRIPGFWQSPAHFSPISEVLLDQLRQAAEVSAADGVIPALTELAVAADSAAHHKTLNTAVLQYMRSDSPAVRLAAVNCQQSLTARLGEEWLALLPEMLPFISELQEDDDEKVEWETLRWIKKIEEVLGESLTPMLQ